MRAGPKRTTAGGRRERGRPARLSRETIVDAAIALLEREPETPPTLSRIAEEVGAVPAALYRHVGSYDALLDDVLRRVLEGVEIETRRRARWASQVRDWMRSVRRQLLAYPAVVALIGRRGRTSPAWFDATGALVGILEQAGLSGRGLALAYLWVAETTMGAIVTEASVPFREQIRAAVDALPEMSETARRRHAPILAHLERLDGERWFERVCDRTIAAIRDRVEGRA